MRLVRRGAALDLGGIAKGAALDLAAGVLREAGVGCALVHGGTSAVVAIGAPPGQRGWRVAIEAGGGKMPCVLLADRALGVSAPSGRVIETEAGAAGHVLDPRSGASAPLGLRAAVVSPSARDADAWSTALVVLAARGERAALPAGATALVGRDEVGSWRWSLSGSEPELFAMPQAKRAPQAIRP